MGTTKHDRMSARHALRALTMVIGLCAMALADAQDGAVREEVFAEADAVRAEAEAANTALFAPESHAEAMEYYNDASEQFERGRRLDRVTEDLAMSIRHFNTAIETTELSKLTLADAITARAAA
jgi:hypothetical protein